MEIKKQIETILENLKSEGLTRRKIEQALGYSENYIDQQVSRGGNKRLLSALQKMQDGILQKTTGPLERSGEIGQLLKGMEKRIIVLEAGVEVLVQSLVEERHRSTGRSVADISLDLKKTMRAAAEARLDELNNG